MIRKLVKQHAEHDMNHVIATHLQTLQNEAGDVTLEEVSVPQKPALCLPPHTSHRFVVMRDEQALHAMEELEDELSSYDAAVVWAGPKMGGLSLAMK